MCKSAAQGGQRCSADARKYMQASEAKVEAAYLNMALGTGTREQYDTAVAAHRSDVEKFASTSEGATEMWNDLNSHLASGNVDYRRVADAVATIDAGARIAAVNRGVENAYRASQGKPPLKTALPVTFAEHRANEDAAAAKAAATATKNADPFGLRAEAAQASQPRAPRQLDAQLVQDCIADAGTEADFRRLMKERDPSISTNELDTAAKSYTAQQAPAPAAPRAPLPTKPPVTRHQNTLDAATPLNPKPRVTPKTSWSFTVGEEERIRPKL